jgi:SOS-response transcriptional repressor LexA
MKQSTNDSNYVGKYDAAVTEFVNKHWRTHFHSPTFKEISDACNMNSTSVAKYTVKRLAQQNQWMVEARGARCITPAWVVKALQKV